MVNSEEAKLNSQLINKKKHSSMHQKIRVEQHYK